jgi:tetratricopeptide (TPR) repeat protein
MPAIVVIVMLVLSCVARADEQTAPSDETMNLTRQMIDAVRRQDVAAAVNLLDSDALFDRLSAGVTAPADFQAGVKRGFAAQAQNIMGAIVKAGGGGAYHFLRIRKVNGETRVLFRILPKGGGVNYHDWVTGRDQQGHLKFQDVYIAVAGELVSRTMHRPYIQAVLAANPGLLDRLTGKDKQLAANLSKLVHLEQDFQTAKYPEVLDAYKTLPASMQEDKSCMIARLLAAEKLRKQMPQEYTTAMADYQRLFPGDASVDLDCIDALFETKQYAEARRSLDRIEAFTGGDAYLLILRGNTYKLEGGDDNFLQAKRSFRKAVEEEPTLALAYWAQVTLSLETEKYDDTAALLTEIHQKLHLKIKDLTKLPTYAGFVQSDAYRKWIAAQTPETPSTPTQQ